MPNKAFYFWPSYCRFNLKAEVILQNSMSFDWIQLSSYSSGCVKTTNVIKMRHYSTCLTERIMAWTLDIDSIVNISRHFLMFHIQNWKCRGNCILMSVSIWKQWAFPSSDCLCWHFLNIFSISCIIMTDGFRKELAYLLNALNDYEQRELSVHMRTPNNFSNSFNCPGDHKLTKTLMASPNFFSRNAFKASLVKWWPFFSRLNLLIYPGLNKRANIKPMFDWPD